jgi:outer membrane murein-binding lipoprotein Lpp
MKKKIINGILMVALVGATSTSFVSCKDNSEDVRTDLVAALNKQAGDLETKWIQADNDLETALKTWVGNQDFATHKDVHDSIANLKDYVEKNFATKSELADSMLKVGKKLDFLGRQIDTLKTDVATLKLSVDTLKNRMDKAELRLDTLEKDVDNILATLTKMVTSVTVNATSTSILANSKIIPGINMQFLGAAYGKTSANGAFPSTEAGDYVKNHGVVLDASDIKGAETTEWNAGDFLPTTKAGKAPAGTVYFTLNPSNVNAKDLGKLELVNSQNAASFVSIIKDSAKVSKEVLTWGITRAEYPAQLWEAPAVIDLKANDLASIDPTKIIDFKDVASDVRAILSEVKKAAEDANRSNYDELAKSTTKSVVKNSAQIVAELLQAKIPALPALALKAEWNDTVGTRSVLSDYSIAATAYKPLSFTWGNDLIDGRTVSFDRLDNLAARIIDKVKAKIPNVDNIEVKDITLGTVNVYNGGALVGTVNLSGVATNINGALDIDDLNNAIKDLIKLTKDAKSYADRAKSFEQRVSDFLEREINRVITKVSTDGLTRVLEPILVYQAGDFNVSRFFEGATVPAGEITLIPTTMTYEVLAPAYKKYVAVKKADGSFAVQKVLTKGDKDFNKVSVNLAAGNYTVIYSAVDFSGNQIAKKYNITVK